MFPDLSVNRKHQNCVGLWIISGTNVFKKNVGTIFISFLSPSQKYNSVNKAFSRNIQGTEMIGSIVPLLQ